MHFSQNLGDLERGGRVLPSHLLGIFCSSTPFCFVSVLGLCYLEDDGEQAVSPTATLAF